MRFRVDIRRKEGLSDPEGLATRRGLLDLGFDAVDDVHFGRSIYVDITGDDVAAAADDVDAMCQKLLANPVMEEYTVTLLEAPVAS
jgi:phosphoribosylformylglycinamidine synthase